ncbi:hypothetical protein M8J77_021115 [Diaphorina citri]|nr:hypothetical protein M8J77_021115 [Diaphorina citri]
MSEPDINDIFDSIACSEEISNEQGYEEGVKKGLLDGEIDGFHLGYHKGAQLGAELGFYKGVVESYLALNVKQELILSEKIITLLEKIKDLISKFPRENTEDDDLLELTSNIRVKYKKVCSLLKIDGGYPYDNSISY